MAEYSHRAAMASQREKVLMHAKEIIRLLSEGVAVAEIQRRINLDDMPGSTFYYHVAKLRKAGNIPSSTHARQTGRSGQKDTASSPADQPAELQMKPDLDPAASLQPEREAVEKEKQEKPSGYDPNKRQRRIRKSVQVGVPEPVDESKGVNPKKWKDIEI